MKLDKKLRAMVWPEPFRGNELVHWKVTVTQPVAAHERLLVVTFNGNRDYKPTHYRNEMPGDFRLICSKKRNEFVALDRENKQTRKRLNNLVYSVAHATVLYPLISERDETVLAAFTGRQSNNHQMDALDIWTEQALEDMALKAADERGELRDGDYDLCPAELPEGLTDWIRREVLPKDNRLLYKKGGVSGLCYVCGEKVRKTSGAHFRQGELNTCPNCGADVIAYLHGSDRFHVDYVDNIAAAQLGVDGQTLFVRQWHLNRDPTAKWAQIEPFLEEFGRYAVRGYRSAKWLHEYKENYCMNAYRYNLNEWKRFPGMEVFDGSYEFYDGTLTEACRGTRFQYADIMGYLNSRSKYYPSCHNVIRYISDWARYPVMEFLWKAGFHELVHERVRGMNKDSRNAIRWQRRKLQECFRFPLRLLKLMPAGKWTMKDVQRLSDLWKLQGETLKEAEITELMQMDIDFRMIEAAAGHATIHKIVKYLGQQQQVHRQPVERTYRDYLQECVQMHLNLNDKAVLFPRDLNEAHQRTMAQIEFEKNKVDQEKFRKAAERLEKFAWEQGSLLIRPAREQKELSKEGAALSHCVGGYIKRMADGETAILFIRKTDEPDKPYFTLELQNKRVIQCRTKHNQSYSECPEVKAFVEEWMAKVVSTGGVKDKKKSAGKRAA